MAAAETAAMAAEAAAMAAAEAAEEAEQAAYVDMMGACYGFNKDQALLIQNAYNLSKSKKGSTHDFVANMAGLCSAYGGKFLFNTIDGIPSVKSSQCYFMKVGLSEQQVADLTDTVNNQYSGAFKDNAQENKDFAHEMAVYAGYFNAGSPIRMLILTQPVMLLPAGDMNKINSYEGDIYSGSMGYDDMNADIDALNVYNSFLKNEQKDFFGVLTDYNKGVLNKEINRAERFLENFRGDTAEQQLKSLKKSLDSVNLGKGVLAMTSDPKEIKTTQKDFLDYLEAVLNEGSINNEKKQ